MLKEHKKENFIVRIHGVVDKQKLLNACKTYCEKVNITKEGKLKNEKTA